MIHQSTGLSVRSVDGTEETPGLRQQLPDRRGSHPGERRSSVHAAEVGQVADEVEFVSDHTEARVLQHAETCEEEKGFPVNRTPSLNKHLYILMSFLKYW